MLNYQRVIIIIIIIINIIIIIRFLVLDIKQNESISHGNHDG